MNEKSKQYVIPVLIIVVGIGWLLNVLGIIPSVDWIWTCGLAACGILTLVVGGIDKLTVVAGSFLLISSLCSVLRQTGKISLEKEIPILTIALGILLLAVRVFKLPDAKMFNDDQKK